MATNNADFKIKKGLIVTEDIELGHASDTTIARASAGQITVEGTAVVLAGGANHDGFSDFVANEHIDHTGVSITAGTGLTGGGTIAATRTLTIGAGTGITVNTNDVAITAAQTGITSVLNTGLVVGRDTTDQIKFSTDNQIIFRVGDADGVTFKASGEIEATKFDGALEGNADTATKITSITNSNIVQLTEAQTLTNKTLTSPTLTTPALGTPSALVLTNATALPAAQVAQGTMASGMVLVAPALGTPASGVLTNATGLPASGLTDNSLLEPKLKITNSPTDNYLLSYDSATTGFTWVEASSGGASAIDGLSDATLGSNSVWLGSTPSSTTSYNASLGVGALDALNGTNGTKNVALGYNAGTANTEGFKNVFVGYAAGSANTDADYNVFVGSQAGTANTTGLRNIAIGANAYDAADTENDNISIGYAALGGAVAGAEKTIAIGNYAADAVTTADNLIAIGYNAAGSMTTGYSNTANSVFIGNEAGATVTNGGDNVVIGHEAGTSMSTWSSGTLRCSYNVLVGKAAGFSQTVGGRNTAVGNSAMYSEQATGYNTYLGSYAGYYQRGGEKNTGIGYGAMFGTALFAGSQNTAIGYDALKVVTTGDDNIVLGHAAGDNITSGSNNVVIGAADVTATASDQLSISSGDGSPVWITGTSDGSVNLPNSILKINGSVGSDGQVLTSTGSAVAWENAGSGGATSIDGLSDAKTSDNFSIGLGLNSLYSITDGQGHQNIAIGANTGYSITIADNNTLIGVRAGSDTNANDNVAVGYQAYRRGTGTANTMIGTSAGEGVSGQSSGASNTMVGYKAGFGYTTGTRNVAIGANSMDAATTESDNIAIGYDALGGVVAGGEKNLVIGNYAGDAVTSGDNNTLIGYNSGGLINTGGSNILIGAYSGDNITTGTGNVQIGRRDVASATGDNQLSISSGGVTNIGWIEGNDIGGVMTKAGIVAISSNTTLDNVTGGDPAQSGSYVYWTAGTLTLPYNATVGTQYVIINCTGASATPGLNSNGTIVNGSHSAMSDDASRTYVCVSALNAQGGAPNWVMIG